MASDSPLHIRHEQLSDRQQIHTVNRAAFGRPEEADLITDLQREGADLISLVAELDDKIVGHILFTRMTIETQHGSIPAVSLAPMAVLPAHQIQTIGSQLVRRGLTELRQRGERIVLVLGHTNYYPRFGFSPDKARMLKSPFPPDAFMALELADGTLSGVEGTVRYAAAFGLF